MHIRSRKPGQVGERDVTPESIYFNRRRLLRGAALGLGGLGLGAGMKAFLPGYLLSREMADAAEIARATAALAPLKAPRNAKYVVPDRTTSPESVVAGYNNYYEFTAEKRRVAELAAQLRTHPWRIEVRGLVEKPLQFDMDDLLKRFALEERIYRHRCVEAWSVVVPWTGIPLAKFIEWAKPTSKAKYLRMVSLNRPEQMPGQREESWYPWPYFEGLRLDEAMNELALLAVGSYGHVLPNQNGSPLRLALPWKYGYKSIKAIVLFEFTGKQPHTFWNNVGPSEYDFLSNVNPAKPHPRWSQASETDVASGNRIPTLPFNGYGEFVASMYR